MKLSKDVLLSQYTTLHLGGVADYVAEVESVAEVRAALAYAKEHTNVPPLVLGGGSNVLISDEGYRGLVMIMRISGREYMYSQEATCQVRLGAGEIFDDVVADTCTRGLWGLENLSSIPGTVGATPVQNVGAYGVEVSSCITHVEAIHIHTGEEKIFSRDACAFGYRDSFFKTHEGKEWIITHVTMSLTREMNAHLEYADLASLQEHHNISSHAVRAAVQGIRAQKFPNWQVVGTAGSFFKNPTITAQEYASLQSLYQTIPGYIQADGSVKVSLGWILDKVCNLKGYCENDVCLYEKQALVLVAHKGATAKDVKLFAEKITNIVFEKTNIMIECEVLFV